MSIFASLFGKETLIGLDIGSSSLKAVQVEAQRGRYRVVRAGQHKIPRGSVRDGIVVNREAVIEALRELLKAANITATGAVLAVSGPTVVVRQVRLPRISEALLKKSIRFEASKYITTNVEDAAMAFEILGPAPDDDSMMDVMLVAAPREMVDSRIAVVEGVGLDAVAVDVEAFALRRMAVDLVPDTFDDDGLRALVDIGAAHTEVTILKGKDFALTRSIPIAGDTLQDAIKNQLRIEPSEAEARKEQGDLSMLVTGDMSQGGDPDLARILQGPVDELLREVRRSIHYYQSQSDQIGETAEVLLAGGSGRLRGMAQYMTARLGVDTRIVNPFDAYSLEVQPEAEEWLLEMGPQIGVALGLAIKEPMRLMGGKA